MMPSTALLEGRPEDVLSKPRWSFRCQNCRVALAAPSPTPTPTLPGQRGAARRVPGHAGHADKQAVVYFYTWTRLYFRNHILYRLISPSSSCFLFLAVIYKCRILVSRENNCCCNCQLNCQALLRFV